MRKKFVTSKSTTKQVTYGIYDPQGAEQAVQETKTVKVAPSQRSVETKDSGGVFGGLIKRRRRPNPTQKAEEFASVLDKR